MGFPGAYLGAADAYVFSRDRYAWTGLDPARVVVIAPSIDVFSVKNQALSTEQVGAILSAIGLLDGAAGDPTFLHEDGTPGRVDRRAAITQEAPLAPDDRVVAQVSRWDRLKDPIGVLKGFVGRRPGPRTRISCSPVRRPRAWPTTQRAPTCWPR